MRKVKKVGNAYTLESKVQQEQTDNLCDYCGDLGCSMRRSFKRLNRNKLMARIGVRSCQSFIPILDFQNGAGCEGDFNTCRMGRAWAERLSIGQDVALGQKGENFGSAIVTNIVTGIFSDICVVHECNNHLALDAASRGETFDLRKVMIDSYGKNWFQDSRPCTFIYLKRH